MTPEIKEKIEQIRRGERPDRYQKNVLGFAPCDWKKCRIGEICKISSGSTPKRDNLENFQGDILWVTSGELKIRDITTTKEKISELAVVYNRLKFYEPGTVVIAIYGLEADGVRGTASIVRKRCTISQACMAFEEFSDVDNEFFYYWYIQNGQVIGQRYAQGTKQQNLSSDIVRAFPICLPNIKEQRKIAEILTTQDRVIELQEKKIKELQRFKKACLAMLFPRKGSSVPEKRFDGFSGDWEQRKVRDIANRYDNLRVPVAANLRVSGITPYYGANGIQDYVEGFTHEGEFVLIAEDGANDLKNYPVKYVNGRIWVNNHAHVLQGKTEIANNQFLAYSINQVDIESLLVGSSRAKLNAETLMDIKLSVPSFVEQRVISDYLYCLDNLISLNQRKLDEMRKMKKSLMQLLLTGIVRV